MRVSRSTIPVFLFALVLAISLSAGAQSPATNQSSQPQSAPPQAAPANPPSAQQNAPSNGQSAQANEDNPLNLTDEQKTKLRPIIMEENQQMEALRNDTTMTQEQKIAKANQIRADASPKIKAILTPEQLQKLAELQQERAREQQQQSQPAQPNNSQPNSQPPQSQAPPK
jgi:periplasmic protein CpxP/Spy